MFNVPLDDVQHVINHLFGETMVASNEECVFQDGIRARERPVNAARNILIRFVVEYIARKKKARLDAVPFKIREQITTHDRRPFANGNGESEPVDRGLRM